MPIFRSFAKVNLHLEVLGRRDDGYHELRTVFSTVDLADELRIDAAASGVQVEVAGADLPGGEANLVHRAASAYLAAGGGLRGVRVDLRKRIPMGGGLGGGSSNAAATLLGMASLDAAPPGRGALERIAADLGADVPFFLVGGRALGRGRGDELLPLADLAPPLELWLAIPPFAISTAEVFARLAPAGGQRREREGGEYDADAAPAVGRNDLEAAAFGLRPELGAVYTRLVRSRARVVRMSGSGSTIFAIFDDPAAARAAGVGLPSGTAWFPVRTLGRSEWYRASGFGSPEGGD